MFRFASGQLVLLALTACVGAQSSGFLKLEVVSVLQQSTTTAPEEWGTVAGQLKANARASKAGAELHDIQRNIKEKKAYIQELRQDLHGPVGYAIDGTATVERDAEYKAENRKLNAHHQMAIDIVLAARELVRKAADARELVHLQASYSIMQKKHQKEKALLKVAMDRFAYVMSKKYACTTASNRHELKRMLASRRFIGQKTLDKKQSKETKLFNKRRKCMQKVRGDQSVAYDEYNGNDKDILKKRKQLFKERARVARCMNAGAQKETIPVVQLNEKATVKKQTASSQQMKEQKRLEDTWDSAWEKEQMKEQKRLEDNWEKDIKAVIDEQIWKKEQKQLEDTWEKDIKNKLPKCEKSTATDKKVVDVKEKESKAVDNTD